MTHRGENGTSSRSTPTASKKAGKGYTRVDEIYISVSRMGFAAEKHFSIYQKKTIQIAFSEPINYIS